MRLISFALYGYNPIYRIGALENLRLAKQIYPGWTCRFYLSQEIPESIAQDLTAEGGQVIRRVRKHEADGMFWRFEPVSEPRVEVVIFRDIDARLSMREKYAVDEWLASDYDFHIMRDHPESDTPILGCGWGARRSALQFISQKIAALPMFKLCIRSDDERFLAREIYPVARENALIHSECVLYLGEKSRPFPTLLKNPQDYVGRIHPVETDSLDDKARTLVENDPLHNKARVRKSDAIIQGWINGNIEPKLFIYQRYAQPIKERPPVLSTRYPKYKLQKIFCRLKARFHQLKYHIQCLQNKKAIKAKVSLW